MAETSPPGHRVGASPSPSARRRTWVWAVLVVLVAIVASTLGYWYGRTTSPSAGTSPVLPAGPTLMAHVEGREVNGPTSNLSAVAIDLFSVVPGSLRQPELGLNLVSVPLVVNPYFVEIGSGMTNSTGGATISLSSEFTAIENEWRALVVPPTENVSIQLQATYVEIEGSNASAFHYYDQVDFNPLVPVTELQVSFVLNLSTPYASIPLGSSSRTGLTDRSASCGASLTTTWSTLALSVLTGPLPLAGLVDNLSLPSTQLVLVEDGWILSPTIELGFGGVQSAFPGLVEASVHPSWVGTIPNFIAESSAGVALTNFTDHPVVPWVGLTGVTYLIVGQRETILWEGSAGCGSARFNITFVTSSIPVAQTGLPVCGALGCSSILYATLGANNTGQELESLPGQTLLNSTTLLANSSVSSYVLTRGDTQYASALAAEDRASGTPFAFTLNLGDDILLADAAEIGCNASCFVNPSEYYEPALAAEFGPAVSEIPSQGVFAFAVPVEPTSKGAVQIVGYGDLFTGISSASLFLYAGSNATLLNVNGIMYGASIPDLGPVVCATGDSPGRGC